MPLISLTSLTARALMNSSVSSIRFHFTGGVGLGEDVWGEFSVAPLLELARRMMQVCNQREALGMKSGKTRPFGLLKNDGKPLPCGARTINNHV